MERSRSSLNPFQAIMLEVQELRRGLRILSSKDRSLPDWIAPTLLNGWTNFGGSEEPAGYWRNSAGLVMLKGAIKGGSIPASIFILPEGLRPKATQRFPTVSNNAFGVVTIDSLGVVTVVVGDNIRVNLVSVIFRAEQ